MQLLHEPQVHLMDTVWCHDIEAAMDAWVSLPQLIICVPISSPHPIILLETTKDLIPGKQHIMTHGVIIRRDIMNRQALSRYFAACPLT